MITQIFEVNRIGNGLLYVMPMPNSGWLTDDVLHISTLSVTKVVSLLEISEEHDLGLSMEQDSFEAAGIEFLNFQIPDRGLPDSKRFCTLVNDLYGEIISGKNMAVHCRAGIGRTGLLASCLLIKDKYTSQDAIDMVSAARGVPIPGTQAQYDFICDYGYGEIT